MPRSRSFTQQTEFKLLSIFIVFIFVYVVGVLFYHIVENFSFVNAVYFTAMTLTTVGYGDLAPQSTAAKLFTSVYVFVGVGIFLGTAAVVFNAYLQKAHDARMRLMHHRDDSSHSR